MNAVIPYLQPCFGIWEHEPVFATISSFSTQTGYLKFQVKSNFKCWIKFTKYSLFQAKSIYIMVLSTSCQFASSVIGHRATYNQYQLILSTDCWQRG